MTSSEKIICPKTYDDLEYTEQWEESILKLKPRPAPKITSLPHGYRLICKLCEHFSLSPEVEFTALDNYEILLEKMWSICQTAGQHGLNKDSAAMWQAAIKRFATETPLTILLVILLAEKKFELQPYFSVQKIKKLAKKARVVRNLDEVVQRESYIFMALDFDVAQPNALRVVEVLVKRCHHESASALDMDEFLDCCLDLLRTSYLKRASICKLLADQERLPEMINNPVLQGAAVVALGGEILQMPSLIEFVAQQTSHDPVEIVTMKDAIQHEII